MRVWSIVVSAGMLRIDRAGTPLILYVRKMPASRCSTSGPGSPNNMLAIATKTTMAGIIDSLNAGLIRVITSPMMA
jgi:hypothetical protein